MSCIFCEISESEYIASNELAYAVWDKYPQSKGHALVILRRHAETFFDADMEERTSICQLLDKVKEVIDTKYCPDGYNIVANCGKVAGQVIGHLHVHLIPRYNKK